jgi:hypothetical protein
MRLWPHCLIPVGCLAIVALLAAGQLSPPPGPVSPTMKTLSDLSAEHAALQSAIGGAAGGGGIKRIVHGVIELGASTTGSAPISPAINPDKSLVCVNPAIIVVSSGTPTSLHSRSGCVVELSAEQISLTVDTMSNVQQRKLSYQIIEYY